MSGLVGVFSGIRLFGVVGSGSEGGLLRGLVEAEYGRVGGKFCGL